LNHPTVVPPTIDSAEVAAVQVRFAELRVIADRLMRRFHQQHAHHAVALLAKGWLRKRKIALIEAVNPT